MKRAMLSIVVGGALVSAPLRAQDPVKVDPKHYKVEFENNEVRILRINCGPGEKSVIHVHPGNRRGVSDRSESDVYHA